jgi:putative membrane protein
VDDVKEIGEGRRAVNVAEATSVKTTPAPDQVKLALERTFLAYERTLMAWIRTSTSMITFGFALYKFFFFLHQDKPPSEGEHLFGARIYGLCIMGIGVLALVLATWQHRQQLKALEGHYPEAPRSLSLLIAALVGSLGVVAFTFAVFRL